MSPAIRIAVLYLAFCGPLTAQHPSYHTFGPEHGLPTSQVYAAYETEDGLLYVAHELGLSRYDGRSFQNMQLPGIKPGTDCLGIYSKKSGVWAIMAPGEFLRLTPGGPEPFKWNDQLRKSSLGTVYDFCYRKGELHLATTSGRYRVGKDGQVNRIEEQGSELNITRGEVDLFYLDHAEMEPSLYNLSVNRSSRPIYVNTQGGRHYGRAMGDTSLYWAGENIISVFQDTCFTHDVGSAIISIHRMGEEVYVSTRHTGLLVYSCEKEGLRLRNQLLGGAFIGIVHQGKTGLWVADLNQGLHFFPSPEIKNYPTAHKVRALYDANDRLLVALRGQSPGFWSVGKSWAALQEATDISVINQGNYLYVTRFQDFSGIPHALNGPTLLYKQTSFGLVEIADYAIRIRDPLTKTIMWSREMPGLTCAELIDDSTVLIGAKTGLFRFSLNSASLPDLLSDSLGTIRGIQRLENGECMVYSDSRVVTLPSGNSHPIPVFHSEELVISSAYILGELMFIGSMEGLLVIRKDGKRLLLDQSDGLIHSNINQICSFGTYLVIGTEKGLSAMPVQWVESRMDTPQLLPSLSAQITKKSSEEVQVSLDARSLNPWKEITVEYRLNNGSFIPQEGQQIILSNLRPGDYTLEIRSRYANHDWTVNEQLSISIPTPLYQRWWFSASGVSLLAIVAILFIRRRNRVLTERLETEKLIANLRMNALNAQMNPHFLFNALNTIQGLLGEDPKLVYTYVSDLARLLRLILENSSEVDVPLEQEVELNRIFCQVENIKQDSKVTFEVKYEAEALKYARIPSLVIQPFVENAMWHAFSESSISPSISISVTAPSQEIIRIRIEDNGIGINSSSHKKKAHESMGVQIVKRRVELFNEGAQIHSHLEINDLSDICSDLTGTRVDLYLRNDPSHDIQDSDNRRRPASDKRFQESGIPV